MTTNSLKSLALLGAICLGIVPLSGCGHYTTQRTSNILTYLYPGETQPVEVSKDISKTSLPNIPLPITLGIAFVPESRTITSGGDTKIEPLTEKFKMEVMRELTAQLRQYSFLAKVEEIPSTYLKIGGSFANLDQIHTMTGVDVIGLVSYDQVQFTDRGLVSLLYWTGIGWYFVPGEKNDTNTMMDAALYHIPTRKPLLRATGQSGVYRYSTPMNQSQNLRDDSEVGFKAAVHMLAATFKEQLDLLKPKLVQAAAGSPSASSGK
ncbi:MAG: rhombotarget lipoprotein [Nitrospirota bacterium]